MKSQDVFPQEAGGIGEVAVVNQPIEFRPIYQQRAWGGRMLSEWVGRDLPDGAPFGESWELVDRPDEQSVVSSGQFEGVTLGELWAHRRADVFGSRASGERFPLLFKILDAKENLSIQVHPPAQVAEELRGEPKTEIWYVARSEEGSKIYVGLKDGVTRDQFERSIDEGTTAELVHELSPKAGDFILVESGRLHAIGAGLLIFEIQQNSDTTYRVFDWNRVGLDHKPRELHVAESLQCIDFRDYEPSLGERHGKDIVHCPHFQIDRLEIQSAKPVTMGPEDQFCVITVIGGTVRCGSSVFGFGQSFLIPSCAMSQLPLEAVGEGYAVILRTTAFRG